MKVYLLNLYYPELAPFREKVTEAKNFVERVAGNQNYRVIGYGSTICTIVFTTDNDPKNFQKQLNDLGEGQFHFLLFEISEIYAGYRDQSVYQWLRDRFQHPQISH